MFWVIISSISMFMFWIFTNVYVAIIAWLINSIWYAASMPLSQSVFWWLYNECYAKKMNLSQIDSTVSAAPLKIVSNFANIVWLILGSIFVWLMWYKWFFIFFSLVLLGFFIYSIVNIKKFWDFKMQEVTEIETETKNNLNEVKKDIDPDFE